MSEAFTTPDGDPPNPARVIIIVGSPRSGTHLLNSVLCSAAQVHPLLAETWPVVAVLDAFNQVNSHTEKYPGHYFPDADAIVDLFADAIAELVKNIRRLHHSEIAVFRVPALAKSIEPLTRLLQRAAIRYDILVMVRDPRDVVASFHKIDRKLQEIGQAASAIRIDELCTRFISDYYQDLMAREHPHLTFIRYEDLVGNPRQEAFRIGERLALDLSSYDPDAAWGNVKEGWVSAADAVQQAWVTPLYRSRVTASSVGGYQALLTEDEAFQVEKLLPEFFRRFGYPFHGPRTTPHRPPLTRPRSRHRMLVIVPGPRQASRAWSETGIGNWAAALPLRLERAGFLDFDFDDDSALDLPDRLADRDLLIVARLPADAWTEARQQAIQSSRCAVYLEAPVPQGLFPGEMTGFNEPASIILGEDSGDPIPLVLSHPETRPMRLDPSLVPLPPNASLEERLSLSAAAYAAHYCDSYARDERLFASEPASALAALALALTAARSGGAAYAEWLTASLDPILAALPARAASSGAEGREAWPLAAALIAALRSGTAPKLPADVKLPALAAESAAWNWAAPASAKPQTLSGPALPDDFRLKRGGAFALWLVAALHRGDVAAAASATALELVEAIASSRIDAGNGGVEMWASMLLASAAWQAGRSSALLRVIWEKALPASSRFIAPFRLVSGGCTVAAEPSDSPYCALALAALSAEIVLPLPPPTEGLDTPLAPAEAWYRTPDMGAAFASAPGEVMAWHAGNGAAIVVRDGNLCVSAVPLVGWLAQAYSAPPLTGTFVNRPMRGVKRLETWLMDLFATMAADTGRPLVRVAPWPEGRAFACTITHDVDRIPAAADFDRLLAWERDRGVKSSWYWIASRLAPGRMEQLDAAGCEIGLHAVLAARKREEIAALAAATPAAASIRGESLHGGAGGDHWRGAATVLQAHRRGLAYTEHCPTAHDLPDTGFAILRADGSVESVPIVGLTHAVCLERNPVKEEEVYHRGSLARLVAAGGHCLISNHPDMSFDKLAEWVGGLPLERAWHATAAEVAEWWRASHDRAAIDIAARPIGDGVTEITVTSREGVTGLTLRVPILARLVVVEGGHLLAHSDGEALVALEVPAGETRIVRVRGYEDGQAVRTSVSNECRLTAIPEIRLQPVTKTELEAADDAERNFYENRHRQLLRSGYVGQAGRPEWAMLCLDLAAFGTISHYVAECRKVHKGNAVREAMRAARLGYCCRFFNNRNHLDDILAIHQSKETRGGRPLHESYFRSVEEQGGYPAAIEAEIAPTATLAWARYFGLFRPSPRRRQGPLVVDEELVAYAYMTRYGEAVFLMGCMGHAAYFGDGIMHKIHIDLIEALLCGRIADVAPNACSDRSMLGVRYLMNGTYVGRPPNYFPGGAGQIDWKRRMLYQPAYLICGSE